MTTLGLMGDTHGNAGVVVRALETFAAEGVEKILHVGDFGFWPGKHGRIFLSLVNTALARRNQVLYVTPGNHEDYTFLNTLFAREDGWLEARSHILVAPRGHRWTWEGVSFVSLGGAPSVDRRWRVESMRRVADSPPSWWPEEAITAEDVERTIQGGYADVMVAHDAPLGVSQIESRIALNPHGFHPDDLAYAYEGRQKMSQVVDVVRPKIFFHGHYHFPVDDRLEIFNENTGQDDTVRIVGLDADGKPASTGVLSLPDLTVSFWR
jgi:hypothetical protein